MEGNNELSDGGRPGNDVRTLPGHEPFEVLHPILYYLYTDRICFTTAPIEVARPLHQAPPFDAEDAYRVGDILGLDRLKEKALNFLVATSDKTNIIPKVFGEHALKYEEVGARYETVFYSHWNNIRDTDALTDYFKELEEERDEEKKQWNVIRRCLKLMKHLTA
jgi:hypothetical protein